MNSYMYGGFSTCCDMIHFHFIYKKNIELNHSGCITFWMFSDLVSPLEVDNVTVLSMLILWTRAEWPGSGHAPGDTFPEARRHVCQLVNSCATNVFNRSRY